mmetsp:Transcript_6693/g.23648  ORF Transcript_6693/g.23648 Transcript_6693/m.23648 type:complete len:123 (+) Transcript_6693:1197-1565(+)
MAEPFHIVRIVSDERGETHFSDMVRLPLDSDTRFSFSFATRKDHKGRLLFRQTPADYDFTWHNAPERQLIVCLDADVEVTVSDGERRVIRAGEIFSVEDVTGRGHISRAVDGKTRRSLFIPY